MKISLCMIVKDEEDTLERCLSSVSGVADEIIIVDTGSVDGTRAIAGRFTENVLDFEWVDDFSAARNFSFSRASMDYILWLDADDVLLPPDRQKLLELKLSLDSSVDVVSMQYHCDFDAQGNVTLNVRRIRLVKRSKGFRWYGAVHEDICADGNLLDSDIAVTHKKVRRTYDRNLNIYEARLKQGKPFTPRDDFHFARELHQHKMYGRAIPLYLKFLEEESGSEENRIFVCCKLADCYYQLGDTEKELTYTFKTFEYDTPRPEACCRLGYHFLQKNAVDRAIYWYTQAIEAPPPQNKWAIVSQPARTWLPHMQLGLCYYRSGRYDLAYRHNKLALAYRPGDRGIMNNLGLLEELLKSGEDSPATEDSPTIEDSSAIEDSPAIFDNNRRNPRQA